MAPRSQKRSRQILLGAVAVMMATSISAQADSPTPSTLPEVWECPQADDIPLYTDREQPGCRAMALKPITIVPSHPSLPYQPRVAETPVAPENPVPPEEAEEEVFRGGFGSSALRFGGAYA